MVLVDGAPGVGPHHLADVVAGVGVPQVRDLEGLVGEHSDVRRRYYLGVTRVPQHLLVLPPPDPVGS